MRTRAAGIVFHNNSLLLMKRIRKGQTYYVIPGGTVENYETAKQAAEREIYEETRVKVKALRLLYRHEFDTGEIQVYYLCAYLKGTPKLEASEELSISNEQNIYEPLFIDTKKLPNLPLLPPMIKQELLNCLSNNFPDKPVVRFLESQEQLTSFQL